MPNHNAVSNEGNAMDVSLSEGTPVPNQLLARLSDEHLEPRALFWIQSTFIAYCAVLYGNTIFQKD
jgi:hypothetical protein